MTTRIIKEQQMKAIVLSFFLIVFFSWPAYVAGQELSPFGVCAHLSGGTEFRQMPDNLQMMHNAGIRWVRVDFPWRSIEPSKDNWDFSDHDKVIEETEKVGIRISGILLSNVKWANPAYKHLDLWLKYVENTVTHYKDKVRVWEVWNEPNLFWENPDGANYATLLKATYKKIKEIDPGLTVLYGGTSGIPMSFIEQSFQAGAAPFFDVLNIHPYRGRLNAMSEWVEYEQDVKELRKLMKKYNVESKKIWITEMGSSSWTKLDQSTKKKFELAKKDIKGAGENWPVGVLFDEKYDTGQKYSKDSLQSLFADGYNVDYIKIPDLKNPDLIKYKALFLPAWEELPLRQQFDEVIAYIFPYLHKGGKVFFYGGNAITAEEQASYLSQSMLLSFRLGIERYFWYEFESSESSPFDREAHFGMVSGQLKPKPAYDAYATLAKVFSAGSVIDKSLPWKHKNFCRIKWKQKDGTTVWAIWNPAGSQQVGIRMGKGLQYALDNSGNQIPITQHSKTLPIGQGITYIVGAETLSLFDK